MELTLSITSALALFAAMAVLAAVPGASVLAVSARSIHSGFAHGALTAAGIVVGDIVFLLIAVFGLVLLVQTMGPAFVLVKYLGGAYLILLSVLIWRARDTSVHKGESHSASPLSSFMTGLLITLGDQKAVLFYLGFLPAFVNLSALTLFDIAIVVAVIIIAVGGVKLAYACAAEHAARIFGSRLGEAIHMVAACIMLAVGVWVIVHA